MIKPSLELTITALQELLRPIVRYCLRHSLSLRPIVVALKKVLAEEAAQILLTAKEQPSASRIAVITGLHRADIKSIRKGKKISSTPNSVLTRVIGAWTTHRKYSLRPGQPIPLTFEGQQSEFSKLVQTVSKEISPYTILRELERVGAVITKGDRIMLKVSEYVPKGDHLRSWQVVGKDIEDLLGAAEGNIENSNKKADLHLKTEFDNIRVDRVDEIKTWLLEEGAAFHDRARRFLSKFDLDHEPAEPDSRGKARAAIGTFSIVEVPKDIEIKSRRRRGRKKILSVLAFVAFTSIHYGCGGGTVGTSGPDTRLLQGQVSLHDGKPDQGLTMHSHSNDGSTNSTMTDSNGHFEMRTSGSVFALDFAGNPALKLEARALLPAPSILSFDILKETDMLSVDLLEVSVQLSTSCGPNRENDPAIFEISNRGFDQCTVLLKSVHNELSSSVFTGTIEQQCLGGKESPVTFNQAGTTELSAEEIFGGCSNSIISFVHNQGLIEILFLRSENKISR
jgi:hypothetical protein